MTAWNPWITLSVAGLLEVGWAVGLKYADGFTKPWPSALTLAAMVASVWLLSQVARHLPIGTAYAVWTGIGAAGTALVGIFYYGEPAATLRLVFLLLLIGSIVGLKLVSPE